MGMADVYIGTGNLDGNGVYAERDFQKGEMVIQYHLVPLTQEEHDILPKGERIFAHTHRGQIFLYGEPERYVNHSEHPNTFQDLRQQCDIALRNIKEGEMITTDATKDDID